MRSTQQGFTTKSTISNEHLIENFTMSMFGSGKRGKTDTNVNRYQADDCKSMQDMNNESFGAANSEGKIF